MKLTIKYHRVRFFIQWLRFYAIHIKGWLRTLPLVLHLHIPFDFYISGFKWNSWKKHKDNTHYHLVNRGCGHGWLISYENFEYHFGRKLKTNLKTI